MRVVIAAAILALQTSGIATAQPVTRWATISDPSGLRMEYASGIFVTPLGPTEQYDGKRFASADGASNFAYYTFANQRREAPAEYLRRTLVVDARNLVYRRVTKSFFVISSIRGDKIFYSRCNFTSPVKCFFVEYPAAQKLQWDPVVTRMSHSLR